MHVDIRPGTPLSDVKRRMVGRGFWLPKLAAEGVITASSTRASATATASATPHTKGPWTEIVTATTTDVTMVTLSLTTATFGSATDTSTLVDIGVGASGSEVVVAANVGVGYKSAGNVWDIPLRIPGGSRIAIRCQSVVISKTVAAMLTLWTFPFGRQSPTSLVTMGADTSTSRGVTITNPASANTKGAWVEISSATAQPFGALVVCEQGAGDTTFGGGGALIDIGVGTAGNEQTVIADIPYSMSSVEIIDGFSHGHSFPADIPLGARIAARWSPANTATSLDIILLGVPRQ